MGFPYRALTEIEILAELSILQSTEATALGTHEDRICLIRLTPLRIVIDRLQAYVPLRWSGLVKEVHTYTYEPLLQLLHMRIQQLGSTCALDRRRFLGHPLDRC